MQDIVEEFQDIPMLSSLYKYWDGKRGGRAMPAWSTFDPVEMREWLGYLNLVAVEEDRTKFRYRIFATNIARIIGRDMTGRGVHESAPDIVEELVQTYAAVEQSLTPLFIAHEEGLQGATFRHHRLLLPLSEDEKQVDKILVGVWPISTSLR